MSSRVSASSCPFHSFALKGATRAGPVVRIAALTLGVLAYASFLAVFLYAIGFTGNWVVPKSIDSGVAGPLVSSLLINAALLCVFVVQHTVMARPGFKRWLTRFIPSCMERSTYVLAASVALGLVFWQWRPLPQVVWNVDAPALAWGLRGLSLAGWALAVASTFLINHFDLFGLRQAWLGALGRLYRPVGFRLIGPYKLVRHPLMVGFLIAFWATPTMTVGHLFFSIMVSGYIAMGVWFEERDLIREHGEEYLNYRREVRGFIPLPRRSA